MSKSTAIGNWSRSMRTKCWPMCRFLLLVVVDCVAGVSSSVPVTPGRIFCAKKEKLKTSLKIPTNVPLLKKDELFGADEFLCVSRGAQ